MTIDTIAHFALLVVLVTVLAGCGLFCRCDCDDRDL